MPPDPPRGAWIFIKFLDLPLYNPPKSKCLDPPLHCHALDVSADEMKVLQDTDTTLQTLKRAAEDDPSEGGYFLRDGLLFRRWTPPGRDVERLWL